MEISPVDILSIRDAQAPSCVVVSVEHLAGDFPQFAGGNLRESATIIVGIRGEPRRANRVAEAIGKKISFQTVFRRGQHTVSVMRGAFFYAGPNWAAKASSFSI